MKKGVAFCRARCLWGMLVLVAGCGGEAPPLDELPLRDALRADPGVVAALPVDSRSRLAARLQAAQSADDSSDVVEAGASAAAEVSALDDTRSRRQADALVVGAVTGDRIARPMKEDGARSSPSLPPVEGIAATATADLEARALDGAAGATLRGLLVRAGARRLERVLGWPTGAIAIGDTVYVDAAWLVALAPLAPGADGGAAASAPPAAVAAPNDVSPIASAVTSPSDGGAAADAGSTPTLIIVIDAGTSPPQPPPPPTSDPEFLDACGATSDACASSGDACDSQDDEDDSCGGTNDDTNSCDPPPDDGSNCRVAPGHGRPRGATLLWVLAPFGYLLGKRR